MMIKKLPLKDSRVPTRVAFPPAQELFDRWKAVPSQENRRMLGLAIKRRGVKLRSDEIIAWAMENLDSSPLAERRDGIVAQGRGRCEPVDGDDPRDLALAALKNALTSIASHHYGMQAIIEEHGYDSAAFNLKAYDYHRKLVSMLQTTARGALADLEALLADKTKGNPE
jgi:hypothetical protein